MKCPCGAPAAVTLYRKNYLGVWLKVHTCGHCATDLLAIKCLGNWTISPSDPDGDTPIPLSEMITLPFSGSTR